MNNKETALEIRSETDNLAAITNELLYLKPEISNYASDAPRIWGHEISFWFYGDDAREGMSIVARAIRRQFKVSESEKDAQGETFKMTIRHPTMPFYFVLYTSRSNVCEKIDTGRVEIKEVPDYANAPKIAKEVRVIEWKCDPILDGE